MVIISVGHRVKFHRGMRFRQWAPRALCEHLSRGCSLNEHRLARQGLASDLRLESSDDCISW